MTTMFDVSSSSPLEGNGKLRPLRNGIGSFAASVLALVVLYHLLTPWYTTVKQRSWILTTISSCIMTIASAPLVWDYVASRGDVKSIRIMTSWTYPVSRFFQAYLVSDLVLGMIYYRSKVNLLTGWIHHTIYIFVVEYTIRSSWTHIFCLSAVMELPTFVLAIGSLYPRFRNDLLFAGCFFSTRILLHIALGVSYALSANREVATNGSIVPSLLLAFIFPLHAFWFYGCLKGFWKRARDAEPRTGGADAQKLASYASRLWTLPRRRGVWRHALLRWEHFRGVGAVGRIKEARTRIKNTLPGRERVYALVGLQTERGQVRRPLS